MDSNEVLKVPAELRSRRQWVLWRIVERKGDKPTKLPYQVNDVLAESDNPATWNTFDEARRRFNGGGFAGVGYVFDAADEFCGIDLDGCRNPETNEMAAWAREWVKRFDSYSEISPSLTGVKIWVRAKSPFSGGKKTDVKTPAITAGKNPGVELYDKERYFAVTGMRLAGVSSEIEERQSVVDAFAKEFFKEEEAAGIAADFHSDMAIVERARRYVAKMPPAISGSDGHKAAFKVACVLVKGFCLSPEGDALSLLREYSQICNPPWSERELVHKVRDAAKASGANGYLRNVQPKNWETVIVPEHQPPKERPKPKATTLVDAARKYVGMVKDGKTRLLSTGFSDLDYAIGGGCDLGEVIIVAARSGHGKSAMSLQWVHNWTEAGHPALFITEEMPAHLLGKRTLQFQTSIAREHWETQIHHLEREINDYAASRAPCYVVESCGTTDTAIEQMELMVKEHGVELVVVDYAQQLESAGKSRYEQITHTSQALTRAAKSLGITLVMLCQMSRAIEGRKKFVPVMSDLKESGQFEQDADVILFLVWPWKLDPKQPPNDYLIYVTKNRNRETNQHVVKCRFWPMRQTLVPEPVKKASDMASYSDDLAEWSR